MEDKEIEQLLKESADKIKMKDFSERWEEIRDRLDFPQSAEVTVESGETVLATSSNVNMTQHTMRKKVLYSLCTVFLLIVICLAVVLPLTLNRNSERKYLTWSDLTEHNVSESEFFDGLEKSNLKIVDFAKYQIEQYFLYYSPEEVLVGGSLEFLDEECGVLATIRFYDSIVKSPF